MQTKSTPPPTPPSRHAIITSCTALVLSFCVELLASDSNINWSMRDSRNGASTAQNLPFELSESNTVWNKKTGTHQYTIPVVDDDRIYLGVNDSLLRKENREKYTGGGMLMCLDKSTGKELWKQVVPRFTHPEGIKKYHFNNFQCGICSSPVISENRLFIVGSDGRVRCLDKTNGSLMWSYDFIKELGVVPHDVCGSTPLLKSGKLYVCTSNGIDWQHKEMPNPNAPSLVVLDSDTGKLLAVAEEDISKNTTHGQWSSPSFARIKDRNLVFFGGGDGKCYAFKELAAVKNDVQSLELAWATDCNPHAYRYNEDGTRKPHSLWHRKLPGGPSPVIATPVVYRDRVYVAIGQSPYHGPGKGMLNCIDAANGKIIWQTDAVDRTTATAAIQEGLIFISDFTGQMHCIDAETGESHWVHDLESDVWCASPVAADGKVYISTSHNYMWVFRATREKEILARTRLKSVPITVVPVDGILYVPTQRGLTLYR